MPSFGLPSSLQPGSSSFSPCISTLLSSNPSSGLENSSAAVPDGGVSHLFGTPHLPPPPPLSLSEASPYSPPPAYPPVFALGPPLLASARFPPPPPPNPSFARPASNVTFFEGPQSHYPPDNTAYDRWSDRCMSSIPYHAGDHIPKSFSHWPLPTYNANININNSSNINNSNAGFLKPEPIFQPFAPYPPVDSVTNFGPKFSPFSGFSNAAAAGMPSTPSASITTPLASGHFTAFPPPNLPLDFPHSSGGGARFPFSSHGSTFLSGMDPPPTFGPGNSEFMPEPFPSYLSRPGAVYQSTNSFQASDPFHDDSPRPVPSPGEITSRPVVSDPVPVSDAAYLSRIIYPPPETFHGSSNGLSHAFSSRSDSNALGPLCSSEGATGLEFQSDFLASFSLPYPPPHPGSLFTPYSCSAPPLFQDSSSRNSGYSFPTADKREEESSDRIVGETGKFLYQHLSPEEWRWKHYEPSFADALDPSGIFARVRPPGFNHLKGVDSTVYSTVPNSSNNFIVREEGCSSNALKGHKDQLDMLDRSKAQNQPGPSLKLAASALAEMLASGSNVEYSMLPQTEAISGTALISEGDFQMVNASGSGQTRPERMLEDCCSSSGSVIVCKDGRNGSNSLTHGFEEPTLEGHVAGLNLGSLTRSRRETVRVPEDSFGGFSGPPFGWPVPETVGQMENSTYPQPMSCVDSIPQSSKGGASHSSAPRRVFPKGAVGIPRQPSVSTGFAKLHGVVAEKNTSENLINVLTQSSNQTSRPQSRRTQKVSSQPAGVEPSDDPTSVIGPSASNAWSVLSLFGPHQEVPSMTGSQLPPHPSHNEQWQVKSTSCGSSPPLSQAHLDQQMSTRGPSVGPAPRVLGSLKWNCPEISVQNEVAYLGTGFHSLTASISNLSKVLFALDSSALTPPDSAVLEETLQSSILRLSECLLLEQARINRNPATRFVGSDESSTSRQGRADGSLADIDFRRHSETGGISNLTNRKASGYGVLPNAGRSGSPSQLCNLNDLSSSSTVSALETVKPGGSVINSNSGQGPSPLNSESYSVSQGSMNGVGFRAGKDSHRGHTNSKLSSSFQQKAVVGDDVIQLLRDNQILERSSLERLIGAEEREAKLKVLVDELREELELERVENRGTVILCEKIMQEAEVSRGKTMMQEEKTDLKPNKRSIECNGKGGSSSIHNSALDISSEGQASIGKDELDLAKHGNERQIELGEEADATVMKHLEDPLLDKVYREVESRLALLRARRVISNGLSGSESEGNIDEVALRNHSEDAALNRGCEGESLRTLSRPEPTAPGTILSDPSESVKSRFALLQARETLFPERSSHEANYDVVELLACPWEKQLTRHDTTWDGVEGRLALLNGRSDWDNELGVFTETEPCTPVIPAAIDLDNSSTDTFSGLSLTERALQTIPSQLNLRAKSVSSTHTACSQLSEPANSKSPEKESNTELRQNEADGDIAIAAREGHDRSQAVEARAVLIRSRPGWTEQDIAESQGEDFLGEHGCNTSLTTSACAQYEADQFETMSEISTVRLLDSDIELSHPLQVKNTTVCPSLPKENRDIGREEFPKFEIGNPAITQDSEEEPGWEHVTYLQFPQDEAE